jgi:hypothetical protein
MFRFSSKTQVDRVFKIKELYKVIKADKEVKEEASYIDKVTVSKVISLDTVNMKSSEECKEIYIFEIELKEKQVPLKFIRSLEEVTKLHTYFVLKFGELIKEFCVHRLIQGDTIKFGKQFESEWRKEDLKELPYCGSIKDIYKNLVSSLIPIVLKENEELEQFIERYLQIQKLKKDIESLEKKAYQAKQPRKKFDLGRDLRNLKLKLKELQGE